MSLVRLLHLNEALCQCCLSKAWQRGLSYSSTRAKLFSIVHLTDLSSFCESPTNSLQVGSLRFSRLQMKHDAHLQSRPNESSFGEMWQGKMPHSKTACTDVANFLREISVICAKMQKLGLPPSTQWQDGSSADVVSQLHEVVKSQAPSTLLHVVTAFSSLPSAADVDEFVRQVIVSELDESMRHLSIPQLLRVVQLHGSEKSLDPSLYDKAMNLLQQRWVEIKTGRDIVALMYLVSDESDQFLDRLEDRALDVCDTMSVKELYRAVYCMSRRQRRNAPLLRALMYYLDRQDLDLSPIHLSNLAYAMAMLNVHDEGVMEKLIAAVCKVVRDSAQPPSVVRHILSSVVQSLGILRWFDRQFMDLAIEQFKQLNVVVSDWARLLHTLASVNYLPVHVGKSGVAEIMRRISSLSKSNPLLWLGVVWSSCVLDSLTSELAASVLSPQFVDKLQGEVLLFVW